MSMKMSAMSFEGFKINNVEYLKTVVKIIFKEEEYTIKTNTTYFEHHVRIVTEEVFEIIIEKNYKQITNKLKNEIINDLNISLITKVQDYTLSH